MDIKSNFQEFKLQPPETQAALVWKYGVFLERTFKRKRSYWLYGMYGFYVELEMTLDEEDVFKVTAFRNGKYLEKYLDNIDWEGLMAA